MFKVPINWFMFARRWAAFMVSGEVSEFYVVLFALVNARFHVGRFSLSTYSQCN